MEDFASLLADGVVFPALVLAPDNTLLDGRHRMLAHETHAKERGVALDTVEVEYTVEESATTTAKKLACACELNRSGVRAMYQREKREVVKTVYKDAAGGIQDTSRPRGMEEESIKPVRRSATQHPEMVLRSR